MPKTFRGWAILSCKLAALVCCTAALLAGHPPSPAQSPAIPTAYPSYPSGEQVHVEDTMALLQRQIDYNRSAAADNAKAIKDVATDFHAFEVQEAGRSGAGTWINGGTALAVLSSIGLQIKGRKRRRDGETEED